MRAKLLCLLPFILLGCRPRESTTPPQAATGTEQGAAPAAAAASEAPSTPPSALPDATAVLAKAVEAVGGKEKLAAVRTYYLESVMKVEAQNLTASNKLWWTEDRFLAETDMPGVGLTRVWGNRNELWAEDPLNGRRRLSGVEAEQTRWGNALVLAADWKRYFDSARTQARREHEGKVLVDVVLSSAEGDEVVLSFEESSGLLLEQQFKQVTPMGAMPLHIYYLEYQQLNGIKVPTRSLLDLNLMQAEQTILKLQTNVEIDPARLSPPGVDAPAG